MFTHLHSKTENYGEYDGGNLPLHVSSSVSTSSNFKYLSICHKNPDWETEENISIPFLIIHSRAKQKCIKLFASSSPFSPAFFQESVRTVFEMCNPKEILLGIVKDLLAKLPHINSSDGKEAQAV